MLSARCGQHVARDAVGTCVRCQRPVCDECVTRLDGINHCVQCLVALRRPPPSAARDPSALVRAIALCVVYGLVVVAWLLLFGGHGARP